MFSAFTKPIGNLLLRQSGRAFDELAPKFDPKVIEDIISRGASFPEVMNTIARDVRPDIRFKTYFGELPRQISRDVKKLDPHFDINYHMTPQRMIRTNEDLV